MKGLNEKLDAQLQDLSAKADSAMGVKGDMAGMGKEAMEMGGPRAAVLAEAAKIIQQDPSYKDYALEVIQEVAAQMDRKLGAKLPAAQLARKLMSMVDFMALVDKYAMEETKEEPKESYSAEDMQGLL